VALVGTSTLSASSNDRSHPETGPGSGQLFEFNQKKSAKRTKLPTD